MDEYPVEVNFQTSSSKSKMNMSWFPKLLDSEWTNNNPANKILCTADDGISQMYTEVEQFNTTTGYAQFLYTKPGYSFPTSSKLTFYCYYNTRTTSNSYTGTVGTTPAKLMWQSNFYEALNFAGTTTDSVTGGTASVSGGASYTTDCAGMPNSAFNFTGTNYINALALPVTPTSTEYMWNFAFPSDLANGSYTMFYRV